MKGLLGLITTALISSASSANAKSSIEVMLGHKNVGLDVKASGDLTKEIHLFTVHRPSRNLNNQVSYFGLLSAGYRIIPEVSILLQAQVDTKEAAPRIGIEYDATRGNFRVYGETAVIYGAKPHFETLINLSYVNVLIEEVKLQSSLEAVALFSPEGYEFSAQRARLSLLLDPLELGPAANLSQTKEGGTTSVGLAVKVKF